MKGVLNKTAIWVTKYQSGERSRKLNVGFAKVFFFLAKVHDTTKIYLNCMYTQWDLVSLLTVVVFSDRQLQRRSQVHSLPKLRCNTRATKNNYFLHFSVSNTMTGFCESFAKVRESNRERRGALQRSLHVFSSMSHYILHFPN